MNINRFTARSIRTAALVAFIWGIAGFAYMVKAQTVPPYAKTAAAMPTEACAGCRIDNATEMVFSKFYSQVLNAD